MRGRVAPVQIVSYVVLTAGAAIMIFPFVWMLLTSLKPLQEIYSLSWLPRRPTLQNYVTILFRYQFARWFLNSLIVGAATTLSTVVFCSLTGYTLTKLGFPGKGLVFVVILATLFVPTEMLVLPWYASSVRYGWVDTYWGIMFPGMIHAFGVFLMRQFFHSLPDDLLDAARVDGLSELGVFWRVALPLMRSPLAALAILAFLGNWNAFIWPLIVTNRSEVFTLPVGLAMFSGEAGAQWNLITAGATLSVFPVLLVFVIFQRHIIESVASTGVKG